MKQYWIFMLNSLCNLLFCAVDQAFSNHISIDAIVVMGSFVVIEWLCTNLTFLGFFGYQILQKYEKNCCLISLLSGIIIGAVCVFAATPITHLFEITDIQKNMLKQLLIAYGLCLPMESVSRFLQGFIIYKCYNKLVIWANFGTYILLILTDYLAIKLGYGVLGLVLSTELTWLVYLVIVWVACKFYKQDDKISFKKIKDCIKAGKDLLISRTISRIATTAVGHFASTMGSVDYAIHAVVLGMTSQAEWFRDAFGDYTIIKLRDSDNKPKEAKNILKQCILPAMLLPIIAVMIMVFFMHGKVDIISAYKGAALYSLVFLIYPLYDLLQAYIISENKAKYITVRGCISAFWKIVVLGIVSTYKINLLVIAIINILDYISSQIYYMLALKISRKKALQGRCSVLKF